MADLENGGQSGERVSLKDARASALKGKAPTYGSLKLPSNIDIVKADGTVTSVPLAKAGARLCFDVQPPGGWYGPFGFLRLVAYGFAGLVVVAILCSLWSLYQKSWFNAVTSVLLAVGSSVASMAAYSHEGLANEVSAIARQNKGFAANNDRLRKQLKELTGVAGRIKEVAASFEGGLGDLNKLLDRLDRCDDTIKIGMVLRAFVSADAMFGDRSRKLEGSELDDFLSDVGPILAKTLPEFDMEELRLAAARVGFNFVHLMLVVNALVFADDDPDRADAMLSLTLFSMEPWREERQEKIVDDLDDALKDNPNLPAGGIRPRIQELVNSASAAGGNRAVPMEALRPVAFVAMSGKLKPSKERQILNAGITDAADA